MTGQDQPPPPCRAPVIVLTAARSGSTLLRFILDSHPDLACPPETNVLTATVELARAWNVLEAAGTRRSATTTQGIALPPQAAAAIRQVIDRAYGTYLTREGKRRWCDKSLQSAAYAEFFRQIYPDSQFICLYRHCMDFILSAVEACPWGLTGFGFDRFATRYPGNSVAALGAYWLEQASAIARFESAHPGICHRIRYEDLVSDPEHVIGSMFDFLGVQRMPGITEACFSIDHAANGQGDTKILFTSRIETSSVGRGSEVPVGRLPEDLRQEIGRMQRELGYEPAGGRGSAMAGRARARARAAADSGSASENRAGHDSEGAERLSEAAAEVWSRITSASFGTRCFIMDRWPALDGSHMRIVVRSPEIGTREFSWKFDIEDFSFKTHGEADSAGNFASITGSPETWLSVLSGKANMSSEIVTGRLCLAVDGEPARFQLAILQATAIILGLSQTPRRQLATA